MGDEELLSAWNAGDGRAGEQLFRRHFVAVARFFRTKIDGDVEDLVQRTFLGCLEGRARFRGAGTFRSYLFGIAYRVLYTHYRSKRADERIDLSAVSLHDLSPSPSTIVAQRREHQLLLAGLRRISLDYQVVLELYFWEGMTAAELAAVLSIPLGTALTRLRRARERLEAVLAELAPGVPPPGEGELADWARSLRELVIGPRASA